MNRSPDVELVLRDYLADDSLTAPDYILDVVEGRISRQPQRRSWRLPWRNITTELRLAAALAAAVVVAVVGYNLLPGNSGIGGPSPTPSPSPTAPPVPEGVLEGGRYRFNPFIDAPRITIVAEVPAGWYNPLPGVLQGPGGFSGPEGIALGFLRAEGLFSDPCHWDVAGTGSTGQRGDIDVGPRAIDLVGALRANSAYTSTAPSPVSFGDYAGYQMEIQFPAELASAQCDLDDEENEWILVFSGAPDTVRAPGIRDRWLVVIVDVGESRVIVIVPYFEGTPIADQEAAQSIIESLEFTP